MSLFIDSQCHVATLIYDNGKRECEHLPGIMREQGNFILQVYGNISLPFFLQLQNQLNTGLGAVV